jgi:hypothetical protein
MRLYRRSHGLRQICNVAVYILHTACTIHLLNLPDKNAKRDITHGIKHLEEIAEGWLCARRTLAILSVLSQKWKVELPADASEVLARADAKYGAWGVESPKTPSQKAESMSPHMSPIPPIAQTAPIFFNPILDASSSGVIPPRRPLSQTTLQPQTAADFQQPPRNRMYNRLHQTPSSAPVSRASIDSNVSPPGGSPSALFGGVDQLLRDSSDWWLKDQSQLAVGFEQWPMAEGEWMAVANSTVAIGDNVGVVNGNGVNGVSGVVNGVNGIEVGIGNEVYNGVNAASGFGAGIGEYNENEWYS